MALFAMGLLACGADPAPQGPDPFRGYCAQRAACEGGNDRDVNACVASFNGTLAEAAAYGCRDVYNVLVQCLLSGAHCVNGHLGAECSAQQAAANDCFAMGSHN